MIIFIREKNATMRVNRKLDKKIKELMLQVEEERRHADQYKEQVSFLRTRLWVDDFLLQNVAQKKQGRM